jgi:hypothetical protein
MTRNDSIKALLDRSKQQLTTIEKEYDRSLEAKAIEASLKVHIKNFCENLRSVLDYSAADIREELCPSAGKNARFYFPIFRDAAEFERQTAIWFPKLREGHSNVWNYLRSIQPFNSGREWLGWFNEVNNQNKHGNLVEQIRRESQETRVTGPGGGSVSWTSGVTFGPGISVMGVPIDPRTQLPIPHPSVRVERITWVDFHFADLNISAIGLLRQSLTGVREIASTVQNLIKQTG